VRYRIRWMTPADMPALSKLHAEQNKRDGTSYPMSQPFTDCGKTVTSVPIALTITRGDEIRQGVAVERGAELLLFGCDPRATAELHRQIHGVFYLLAQRGYSVVHCFVPKRRAWWRRMLYRIASIGEVRGAISRSLEDVGFVRDDHRLAHFLKDLTEAHSV
jgi:hypothetical protein